MLPMAHPTDVDTDDALRSRTTVPEGDDGGIAANAPLPSIHIHRSHTFIAVIDRIHAAR